ncbi:hypothetical protein [Providencia stuartii]|uniref:hypothetical protein n=1 Tax=Providencia stuartii TaxID=588 RepID=UPI0024B21E02
MFTQTESSDSSDLLTYEDLTEKALAKGTATTRIRMGIDEDGQVVGYHTSAESGVDQVRGRIMGAASEAEAQKVRPLAVYQSANGLPTAASTAEVYKFVTDEGDDFLSVSPRTGNWLEYNRKSMRGKAEFIQGTRRHRL